MQLSYLDKLIWWIRHFSFIHVCEEIVHHRSTEMGIGFCRWVILWEPVRMAKKKSPPPHLGSLIDCHSWPFLDSTSRMQLKRAFLYPVCSWYQVLWLAANERESQRQWDWIQSSWQVGGRRFHSELCSPPCLPWKEGQPSDSCWQEKWMNEWIR